MYIKGSQRPIYFVALSSTEIRLPFSLLAIALISQGFELLILFPRRNVAVFVFLKLSPRWLHYKTESDG